MNKDVSVSYQRINSKDVNVVYRSGSNTTTTAVRSVPSGSYQTCAETSKVPTRIVGARRESKRRK